MPVLKNRIAHESFPCVTHVLGFSAELFRWKLNYSMIALGPSNPLQSLLFISPSLRTNLRATKGLQFCQLSFYCNTLPGKSAGFYFTLDKRRLWQWTLGHLQVWLCDISFIWFKSFFTSLQRNFHWNWRFFNIMLARGGSRTSARRGRQSLGGWAPTQYFSRIFWKTLWN